MKKNKRFIGSMAMKEWDHNYNKTQMKGCLITITTLGHNTFIKTMQHQDRKEVIINHKCNKIKPVAIQPLLVPMLFTRLQIVKH